MDDIRYSEMVYLQKLATGARDFEFFRGIQNQAEIVGLSQAMYVDMAITLLEEAFICFDHKEKQLMVGRLRDEVSFTYPYPDAISKSQWANPREGIRDLLTYGSVYKLNITFRGFRRIEDLREQLSRDRILERFGILLDFRYVPKDLRDALQRPSDIPISVLYADLDKFKPVNDEYGHEAGDIVLTEYLKVVSDSIGSLGTAYRGTGDEIIAIIIGQGHERAVELAEKIRASVAAMKCEFKKQKLPGVTTSIGVATTLPEPRTVEIESVAEARNREAKNAGRNRVIFNVSSRKKKSNRV